MTRNKKYEKQTFSLFSPLINLLTKQQIQVKAHF